MLIKVLNWTENRPKPPFFADFEIFLPGNTI